MLLNSPRLCDGFGASAGRGHVAVTLWRSARPVTLIGGGAATARDLSDALALAPIRSRPTAAPTSPSPTGSSRSPSSATWTPSATPPAAALADRLHPVEEQDSTDFDKALARIDAPAILAVGFSGGRLDHELAALHSLSCAPTAPACCSGPRRWRSTCRPRSRSISPPAPWSRFSLRRRPLPLHRPALADDHLAFAPWSRVGTSNESAGPVTVTPSVPGMLLILPRATLPLALAAVLAAPRWPASPGG
jgi:thiamine pyrophosphokinase